ncbi:hypothetical protein BDR06DRAFT_1049074 [Suillus hirtellus]|nr:hypothetical protein BDR06DRAFT_1049074 [Suillus hirtellus]
MQLSNQPPSVPTSLPILNQPSYSTVAASRLPPSVDQAIGRAAIRAWQILLDPQPGEHLFPHNTSNTDIVKKLREALSNIHSNDSPPGDVKAVHALCNGGVIVELENEELAFWLCDLVGRTLLEGQFDTAVSFCKRTYTLVLEYLPIQLQIENDEFLRHIEHKNDLPTNSLASVRWIKPPTRRMQEQRKAFALLQVIKAPTANNILRDGLCINSKHVGVRKDKREPIRCAKCQHYGHIARACLALMDTCGTCSGGHRTTQCTAYHTTRCVNCSDNTHMSWSRKCLEFARRCELMDKKFPENRMPYYHTESAWTHTIQPPKPPKQA